MAKNKTKINKKRILWILLFIVLIVVILVIIQIPYTGLVTYADREPYSDKDCTQQTLKSVSTSFSSNINCIERNICTHYSQYCIDKNWLGNCIEYSQSCDNWGCSKSETSCTLTLKNIDDTAGSWTIELLVQNSKGGIHPNQQTDTIQPTLEKTFTFSYPNDYIGESTWCNWNYINQPTKSVCENVLKYRDIEKTKEEIRYCSALKKLLRRCN